MQLQTITDDYAKLNRDLHESHPEYGTFSWRHAEKVLALRDETESVTVLDYGCGKGALREALRRPEWLREYDPAIPGKDARPEIADLVVCTDVLEHIEPHLLDNVLTHIVRCTAKAAFLLIATRPASKTLADGSNAHKIIENAAWWREKLEKYFFILEFESTHSNGGEVGAVVSPVRPIHEIKGKSAVSDTIRYENAVRNCGVVKERVLGGDMMPRHEGRICIVGYGPSLHQTWQYLNVERRLFGAKIATVSGAHDFLISRGIIPDYHTDVDPREHKGSFTRNPHPGVKYWMASCLHPSVIDNLVNHKAQLALWHVLNSDTDIKIQEIGGPDPDSLLVCGGSGVGARAISLFYVAGYRSFSLYGMDSSFGPSGEQHAGEHNGKRHIEWNVRVGERWFRSSASQVYMARSVLQFVPVFNKLSADAGEPFIPDTSHHVEFFFHGDGLLQAMALESSKGVANGHGPSGVAQAPGQPAQAQAAAETADHLRSVA
jgi:hypothetical protein